MHPAATGGLRPAHRAELGEHLLHHHGHLTGLREAGTGLRIQIDAPLVGAFDVGAAGIPGMELHGAHLHRPDHLGQFGDAQFVREAPGGEAHPHGLHPRGSTGRQPLLVHLGPGDSAGKPVQHAGTLTQRADDALADRKVVTDEIDLGLTAGGEVDPVRIGDPDGSVTDFQLKGRCVAQSRQRRLAL
jgi:hypothetical protein